MDDTGLTELDSIQCICNKKMFFFHCTLTGDQWQSFRVHLEKKKEQIQSKTLIYHQAHTHTQTVRNAEDSFLSKCFNPLSHHFDNRWLKTKSKLNKKKKNRNDNLLIMSCFLSLSFSPWHFFNGILFNYTIISY